MEGFPFHGLVSGKNKTKQSKTKKASEITIPEFAEES